MLDMRKTVPFFGSCTARSEVTLVSGRISTAFVLRSIRVSFAAGCWNELRVKVFIATDDEAPASGEPSGVNVFEDYGHVGYVVGNGELVGMLHDVEVRHRGSFLKVYAENLGYEDQDVNGQLGIELMGIEG